MASSSRFAYYQRVLTGDIGIECSNKSRCTALVVGLPLRRRPVLNLVPKFGRDGTGGEVAIDLLVATYQYLIHMAKQELCNSVSVVQYFAPQDVEVQGREGVDAIQKPRGLGCPSPESWEFLAVSLSLGQFWAPQQPPPVSTESRRFDLRYREHPDQEILNSPPGCTAKLSIPLSASRRLSATVKSTFAVLDWP